MPRDGKISTFLGHNINAIKNPDNSKIRILCYDIECTSSHGDFPLPKKDYLKFAREIVIEYESYSEYRIRSNSKM